MTEAVTDHEHTLEQFDAGCKECIKASIERGLAANEYRVRPGFDPLIVESIQRFISPTWAAGAFDGKPCAVQLPMQPVVSSSGVFVVAVTEHGSVLGPYLGGLKLLGHATYADWVEAVTAARELVA